MPRKKRATSTRTPHQLDVIMRRYVRNHNVSSWRMAEVAWEFQQAKGWRAFGMTQKQYIDERLQVNRREYYRSLRIWSVFSSVVPARERERYAWSKLGIAASAVDNGIVSPYQALTDVQTLTARGLYAKYGFGNGDSAPAPKADDALLNVVLSVLSDQAMPDTQAREVARTICEYWESA